MPAFPIDTNTDAFYSHSYGNRHGNPSRFADTHAFGNPFPFTHTDIRGPSPQSLDSHAGWDRW